MGQISTVRTSGQEASRLVALAKRVAALNPSCAEIGAGMLASLVSDANDALQECLSTIKATHQAKPARPPAKVNLADGAA